MTYFKSDGNGGYVISKPAIAIITLSLLIIGMIVPAVFGYGQLNQKVDILENNYEKIDDKLEQITFNTAQIDVIQKDIEEIKEMIRS